MSCPPPGCFSYCRTALPDYTRVSQDEGPRQFWSLLRHYDGLLESGIERIVIDRINPLRWQRQRFADLARAHGYRVRIVYLDAPRSVCRQRILRRKDHPTLTADKMDQAIGHFENLLEIPTEDECDQLEVVHQDQQAD